MLKSSGGNQIQVQPLNSGDDFWNGDSSQTSVTHTWSDGSPSASGSSAAQGVMTSFANGAGLRLSFPASADLKRTVRIYWEAYSGQASIRAHLSDGSTSDLVYSETAPAGNLGGPLVTEFSYVAGSASQTLQVELVMEQGGGTVTLQAAAIVAATPVSATALGGSNAAISGNVNLSSVGAIDWIKYDSSTSTVQTKASGGNQIQVQALNGGDFWNGDTSQTAITHSWSDGSPTTSGSSSAQGVVTSFANGAGIRLTFPASAELQRTVRIYWEGYSAQTRVKAHLGDGSAADLVYSHTTPADALGGPQVAEFTYTAAARTRPCRSTAKSKEYPLTWLRNSVLSLGKPRLCAERRGRGRALGPTTRTGSTSAAKYFTSLHDGTKPMGNVLENLRAHPRISEASAR